MALPATNDPSKTTLVSGVDVVITAARHGAHPKEAEKLIDFLMQPKVMSDYCKAQVAIPTLEGLTNNDPALERRPAATSTPGGSWASPTTSSSRPSRSRRCCRPSCSAVTSRPFLHDLDSDWDKVAKRRTWGIGAVIS